MSVYYDKPHTAAPPPIPLAKLINKTERYESLHKRNNSLKTAWGLALRYYQCYKLGGDKAYIQKAYHISSNIYAIHFHFIWAYFLCAWLELETGNTAKASAMLDKLKAFKGGFKNSPVQFTVYTLLLGAIEHKKGKNRGARKHVSSVESLNNSVDSPEIDALLGGFALLLGEKAAALEYFLYARSKDDQNFMMFVFMHDLFVKNVLYDDKAAKILGSFLRWAISAGADIKAFMDRNRAAVLFETEKDPYLGKELYKSYPADWLLIKLCETLTAAGDYSSEAYARYKEAESRQLPVKGLPGALVFAAYKNGTENISRYSIEQFFKENPSGSDMEINLFVYFLLVTRNDCREELKKRRQDIIRFALFALENGASGIYMSNICRYLLEELDASDARYAKYLEKAEIIAKESLFIYEVRVTDETSRYVWTFEEEKSRSKIYEISGGKAVITAASPDFKYFLFDDGMKNISESKVTVVSRLQNAGGAFYSMMYEKGIQTPEMLIAMSKLCISTRTLPPRGDEILLKTLALKDISSNFRIKLSAVLGNYYASKSDFRTAVRHYSAANENYLDPRSIESKLITYINAGEYQAAAALISKKTAVISDKALFYSLKKLAPEKKYNKILAPAAYSLTFKNWYDKSLAAIALEHSQASLREWHEFSRALASVNAPDDSLDEMILNNTIWMHRFDPGSQKVFTRLFMRSPRNPFIAAFALYAAYEIIINGVKPEYETIEVIEKLAMGPVFSDSSDMHFLCYALCHVYKNHSINTFHSEEIYKKSVEYCEEDNFIFPLFKDTKDKNLLTPYIEKNQPFFYRGGKGKRVRLYYRTTAGQGDYSQKNMKYVRFGLYTTNIPLFFNERLDYYFSEEIATGSIVSKESSLENNYMRLVENSSDLYYIINNAIIYESMFKYEAVESAITDMLKEMPRIKSWLF